MDPKLTDTLCTRCGLCCDGSLFADAELSGVREATRALALGLMVDEDDGDGERLRQPCSALRGRRCSVYPHRPACCRSFECRLLLDARRGAVSVEQAGAHIADALEQLGRVRKLARHLGRLDANLPLLEGCAEALARNADADPVATRRGAALAAAISAAETLLRTTFLPAE